MRELYQNELKKIVFNVRSRSDSECWRALVNVIASPDSISHGVTRPVTAPRRDESAE
jgi:hypothetical protein